jgi:8-oxo-dGTP pyrophosphatase MutT (NUDIX family)
MERRIHVGVCFFCHDRSGKFIISLRSPAARDERNKWDCGGGELEFGEAIDHAVAREVWEEYCCQPLKLELLGHRDVFRTQKRQATHWVVFDFLVEVDATKCAIREPERSENLRWVSLRELEAIKPNNLHSQLPGMIKQYRDRLFKVSNHVSY